MIIRNTKLRLAILSLMFVPTFFVSTSINAKNSNIKESQGTDPYLLLNKALYKRELLLKRTEINKKRVSELLKGVDDAITTEELVTISWKESITTGIKDNVLKANMCKSESCSTFFIYGTDLKETELEKTELKTKLASFQTEIKKLETAVEKSTNVEKTTVKKSTNVEKTTVKKSTDVEKTAVERSTDVEEINKYLWWFILFLAGVASTIVVDLIFKRFSSNKDNEDNDIKTKDLYQGGKPPQTSTSQKATSKPEQVVTTQSTVTSKPQQVVTTQSTVITNENSHIPKFFSNIQSQGKVNNQWQQFAISIQGKDHLKKQPNEPCQDCHQVISIDENWGVVVVCDGAGSQKYSHIGSKYVTHYISTNLAKHIENGAIFYQDNVLPTEEDWRKLCIELMRAVRYALEKHTKDEHIQKQYQGIDIKNVGCTVILAVYSPLGILTAHIGDGRAGYRNKNGWHSMMTPINGEYENATYFINTDQIYEIDKKNVISGIHTDKLETNVIKDTNIDALVLMSDGCENGLYRTIEADELGNNHNVNKPIDGFSTFIDELKQKINKSDKDAENHFIDKVQKGNQSLVEEGDDKTLVFMYKK